MRIKLLAYPDMTSPIFVSKFLQCLFPARILIPKNCTRSLVAFLALKSVTACSTTVSLPTALLSIFSHTRCPTFGAISTVFLNA